MSSTSSVQEIQVKCSICSEEHTVFVDVNTPSGTEVLIHCTNIPRRYRFWSFYLDATRNGLVRAGATWSKELEDYVKRNYGSSDLENKIKRYLELEPPVIAIVEEYTKYLEQCRNSYISGYHYSSTVSSLSLVERILNRLFFGLLKDYSTDALFRRYHNKQSSDNWEDMIDGISRFEVVDSKDLTKFVELGNSLKEKRHRSIHYNEGYIFDEAFNKIVLTETYELVNMIFDAMSRKDLFLVFDMPGEIWVKESVQNLPFVKRFILPYCFYTYFDFETTEKNFFERNIKPLGKLTDEEFVKARNSLSG